MYLKSIVLSVSKFANLTQKSYFNICAQSMCSIMQGKLHKFETVTFFKICVDCWDILVEINQLPLPNPHESKDIEFRKKRIAEGTFYYQNYLYNLIESISIHRRFDFEKWWNSDKFNRKKMIIDEIYKSLLYLAEKFCWEIQPIHDAYNACVAQNFENNWFIKKFSKTSPNRKFTGNVWVEYDIDSFRTFLIIKDKKDNILEKKLVHTLDYDDENVNPLFDTDLIFKGSATWENNIFILKSSEKKTIGEIKSEELKVKSL